MAACLLSRCCCGCTLRGGTIGISIYTMIVSLIAAAIYGLQMKSTQTMRDFWNSGGELDTVAKLIDDQFASQEAAYTALLVFTILWAISAVFLLIAICSKVRWLLLPWIVFTILFSIISLYGIYVFAQTIIAAKDEGKDVGTATYVGLGLIVGYEALNVYFIFVILSYFRLGCEEAGAHPV